jgi:hypothetical protein
MMKVKMKQKKPIELEFDSTSLTLEEADRWLKKAINFVWLMHPDSKVSVKVELKEAVVDESR